MTSNVATVSEAMPLQDVVTLMERRRIKRVPVTRGDKIVGIISRANLVQACTPRGRGAAVTSKR